ncbi:MAG: addiction module toxin RelE [Kordiimonas sp.]|mgnify:CR=1 FL=1|nr:addiction module toxin RelE [Kordiimonas sp.]
MARPLRIEFPGALYEISAKPQPGEALFADTADGTLFLKTLHDVCQRFQWHCLGFVLMPKGYHLLIETKDANLSRGMRQLNGLYTQKINRKYAKTGPRFQGRFKALVVEREAYLQDLICYFAWLPVRHRLAQRPDDWLWGSFRWLSVKGKDCPGGLACDEGLWPFGKKKSKARKALRDAVREVDHQHLEASLANARHHQLFLATPEYVTAMLKNYTQTGEPRKIEDIAAPTPAHPLVWYQQQHKNRREAMAAAYLSGDYTLYEIADAFGVHYSTVSRAVSRYEKAVNA